MDLIVNLSKNLCKTNEKSGIESSQNSKINNTIQGLLENINKLSLEVGTVRQQFSNIWKQLDVTRDNTNIILSKLDKQHMQIEASQPQQSPSAIKLSEIKTATVLILQELLSGINREKQADKKWEAKVNQVIQLQRDIINALQDKNPNTSGASQGSLATLAGSALSEFIINDPRL